MADQPETRDLMWDASASELRTAITNIRRDYAALEAENARLRNLGEKLLVHRAMTLVGFYDLWRESAQELDVALEDAFPGRMEEIKEAYRQAKASIREARDA